MSPASKSKTKSKDMTSAMSPKEHQKPSLKSPVSTNSGSGTSASAYNPLSGTFHALEVQLASSSPTFHDSGRFRNIDETDEHSSSLHAILSEYDSVSNNGSCSGDSDDIKEKVVNSTRLETVPALDNDRREKIRLKNEKKHQRQRERRAQELHERCSGYLMSRKLEGLSQQVVAMGFSHERATLALMLNGGRLEESVNWLFEGSEEEAHNKDTRLGGEGNSKIDISEELAQISKMESKYKCSKQEVERVVVACEGDLMKAEETLRAQKSEPAVPQQIPEEADDSKNSRRPQEKAAVTSITMLQRRDGRDFSTVKTPITISINPDIGGRNFEPMNLPKTVADKRWTTAGSNPFPSSLAPSVQPTLPPVKSEVRLGIPGNEGKVTQRVVREPVVMMQRPQPMNVNPNPLSSFTAAPSVSSGWYSTSVPGAENMRSNGKFLPHHSSGNMGLVNQNPEQFYRPAPASFKESPYFFNGPVDSTPTGSGGSWSTMGRSPQFAAPPEVHSSYSARGANLPSLTAPSSLGLFTGWGSGGSPLGSSPHVDWNTGGLVPEFDYTSIDWTLNANQSSSRQNGLWLGLSSFLSNNNPCQRNSSSSNGSYIQGLRDNGAVKETSSSAGAREWTSPFAGKDIFSAPRQLVTSPSP